jgi:hypothetical protein
MKAKEWEIPLNESFYQQYCDNTEKRNSSDPALTASVFMIDHGPANV